MLPSLLMMSALALTPAQGSGGLQLTNARNTYGELGGPRPEGKLLPGDILFVAFDIDGISVDPEGIVNYTMAMELLDKNNKPIFKQEPATKRDFMPLGGNKLPARAFVTIGLDQQPGEYTMKLTVTDNGSAAKSSQVLTRKFEVASPTFGIVLVHTTVNELGDLPAPTTGTVGQAVFVQFGVVGFDRAKDPKEKDPKKPAQPNVSLEITPLDERGQPTVQKPLTLVVNDKVDEKDGLFTYRYLLPMTRVGKFTVRIKATDNLSKKTATAELPITVLPNGN